MVSMWGNFGVTTTNTGAKAVDMIATPPGMPRPPSLKNRPSPPSAWSARLFSYTVLYSGVSGASCPHAQGLLWSWEGWPPAVRVPLPGSSTQFGGYHRSQAPLQSGYFAPPAGAATALVARTVAAAIAWISLRQTMVDLPFSRNAKERRPPREAGAA